MTDKLKLSSKMREIPLREEDRIKIDYTWTDGTNEVNFHSDVKAARNHRELRGQGKVWRREFDAQGYLIGVTDVTNG